MAQLNRPDSLNAFTQDMLTEALNAVRELNEHPETVFTVLTGEGRFFSAGADIRGEKRHRMSHEVYVNTKTGSPLIQTQTHDTKAHAKLGYSRGLLAGEDISTCLS